MAIFVNHLIVAGKLQHRGKLCGCDYTADALGAYRRPGVRVELLPWNLHAKAEAAFIHRHRPQHTDGRPPIVCIHCYSHGLGCGARRLARELARYHIKVFGLRGCDGVWRSDHWPLMNAWRCLWPGSTIVLPNVRREGVELFVQKHSWVRGHSVTDEHGDAFELQEIKDVQRGVNGFRVTEPATHYNLDESPQWRDSCLALAEEVDALINTDPVFRAAEREAYAMRRRFREQCA